MCLESIENIIPGLKVHFLIEKNIKPTIYHSILRSYVLFVLPWKPKWNNLLDHNLDVSYFKKTPRFPCLNEQLSLRYDFPLSTKKVQTIYERNNTDLITKQQILNASILMHCLTAVKTA